MAARNRPTRPTRPTKTTATVRDTVLDGKARLSNTARRLRLVDDLLRNTLETIADGAAITRITNALAETEAIRANVGALDGVLVELQEHYEAATAPLPESNEDLHDYQESK